MPSWQELTPPGWNEGDSFRETTLHLIDDPEDREVMCRFGRLVSHLALEATMESGTGPNGESSVTRAELRAVAADLRYLEGYLAMVLRESEESSLDATDQALSVFAGNLAAQVGAVAASIEGRLS